MKHFVALFAVLFATVAVGQAIKNPPTVEQCRADQRVWLVKLASSLSPVPETYSTVHQWASEMTLCSAIDSANRLFYGDKVTLIYADLAMRARHFIQRHELWQQFLDEDKAGKR